MKINLKYLTTLIFLMMFAGCDNQVDAANKHDQELEIVVDADNCPVEVKLVSAVDNCAGSRYAPSCGKNGKDCVCMPPGKFISWTTKADSEFQIHFTNTNPLKKECNFTQSDGVTIKSKNKKRIKCHTKDVSGEFEYTVALKKCDKTPYDPRIVIGSF